MKIILYFHEQSDTLEIGRHSTNKMLSTQWGSSFLRNTQDGTAATIHVSSPSQFNKEDLLTDGNVGLVTNASKQQPVGEWIDRLHNFNDPRVLDSIPSNIYVVLWEFVIDPEPKYTILSIHDKRSNIMASSNYGDFSSILIAEIQKCCTGVSGNGSQGMDKGLAIWGNIHDDRTASVSTPQVFAEGLSHTQIIYQSLKRIEHSPELPDEYRHSRTHNFISGGIVVFLLALAFYVVFSLYMKSLYKEKYLKHASTRVPQASYSGREVSG